MPKVYSGGEITDSGVLSGVYVILTSPSAASQIKMCVRVCV